MHSLKKVFCVDIEAKTGELPAAVEKVQQTAVVTTGIDKRTVR
jgi:hypothetical protein